MRREWPVAAAMITLRAQIAQSLLHHDFAKGWTQAYSLDEASAGQTADFLIYSSLTTVARRPGTKVSWTQNWPFEPLVGNTPHDQHIPVDLDQLLLHFFLVRRSAVHL